MARDVDPRRIKMLDARVAAILRSKTPDERFAMAMECHESGRAILVAQVESAHPEWTAEQVRAEVARRMSR